MNALRGIGRTELLLAIVLLAGIVAVQFLGRGDVQRDTYAVTDYRSGGYAAFFTLLGREGITAEPFEQRPADLTPRIDTLVVAYPPAGIDTQARLAPDVAALRAWVAGGGRLVVLGANDPFATAGRRAEQGVPPRNRVRRVGRGEVVLVAHPERFDNQEIGRDGNARLAYTIARPLHPGGVVAFDETVHGTLIDRTWWQAIGREQTVALAGIALALAVALCGGLLRLGPPVALRERREPASDEFVAAVASLYARSGARAAAIALLAHGARHATSAAAVQLRALAERPAPNDRDLITSARLARSIREGS